VIQPILRLGLKMIGGQSPATKWNGHAKLILFIALTGQRSERKTLVVRETVE
jgi:hypothetical protein